MLEKTKGQVFILDNYLFNGWKSGRASRIRERLAADFHGWSSYEAKFESQMKRVFMAILKYGGDLEYR